MRSGDPMLEGAMRLAVSTFYGQCRVVLSPSPTADQSLLELGIEPERIGRWARGVDLSLFDPARRDADAYPGEVKVLYAGRLSREKGVDLLAESFLRAHERDPRLHLLLAGGGPEEAMLRERLGDRATFLGWLDGEALASRIRERGRLPVLLGDRHVRPGDRRGAGERAAGRRRRRGRAAVADPRPPQRLAVRRRRR